MNACLPSLWKVCRLAGGCGGRNAQTVSEPEPPGPLPACLVPGGTSSQYEEQAASWAGHWAAKRLLHSHPGPDILTPWGLGQVVESSLHSLPGSW